MKDTDDKKLLKMVALIAFVIGAIELVCAGWRHVLALGHLLIRTFEGNVGVYILGILMIAMSVTTYVLGCRQKKASNT